MSKYFSLRIVCIILKVLYTVNIKVLRKLGLTKQ